MAPVVPVYVLSATQGSEQEKRVTGYLQDPLFKVFVVTAQNPANDNRKFTPAQLDFYRIQKCLEDAAKNYPNSPVLILKDTSISTATPNVIANYVRDMIKISDGKPGWDIAYLASWGDNCQLQKDIANTSSGYAIVQSFSPQGVQALLIKPSARDTILGKRSLPNGTMFTLNENLSNTLNMLVKEGQLRPALAKPNLFDFDPELAKSEEDRLKAVRCADESSYQQTTSSSSAWIWILLVIILLIFLGLIFMKRRQ